MNESRCGKQQLKGLRRLMAVIACVFMAVVISGCGSSNTDGAVKCYITARQPMGRLWKMPV